MNVFKFHIFNLYVRDNSISEVRPIEAGMILRVFLPGGEEIEIYTSVINK